MDAPHGVRDRQDKQLTAFGQGANSKSTLNAIGWEVAVAADLMANGGFGGQRTCATAELITTLHPALEMGRPKEGER